MSAPEILTLGATFEPDLLQPAVGILKQGGLVAFPTETVYGLGARGDDEEAALGIFRAKGRPAHNPLIVHLARAEDMTHWAADVPDLAWALARRYWPGPLTLILRSNGTAPQAVVAGGETIALRVPNHPVARALIDGVGVGLAAPSANRSNHISPTTAAHVVRSLGGRVPMVIDGGPCHVGIESSIVDLSRGAPAVLRPGMLLPEEVRALQANQPRGPAPPAPGQGSRHYCPKIPVRWWNGETSLGPEIALLSWSGLPGAAQLGASPDAYAKRLYSELYRAEGWASEIQLEPIPTGPEWVAIANRVARICR